MSNKNRVLLVEDNYLNLRIMSRMLNNMDIEVVEASTSQEAIKYAVNEKFSIIFICNFMPEIEGFKTARQICDQSVINKGVPVVAVVSNTTTLSNNKIIECGINKVISKPLIDDEVKAVFLEYKSSNKDVKAKPSLEFEMFNINDFDSFYNDPSLQREIVLTFINEKQNDLNRLNKSFESKDSKTIYETLHYLKGSFSYLKANKVLKLTQSMLDLIKADKLSEVLLLEKTFYEYYNKLYNELSIYFKTI